MRRRLLRLAARVRLATVDNESASEGDEIRLLLPGQIWHRADRSAFSQFDQHLRSHTGACIPKREDPRLRR